MIKNIRRTTHIKHWLIKFTKHVNTVLMLINTLLYPIACHNKSVRESNFNITFYLSNRNFLPPLTDFSCHRLTVKQNSFTFAIHTALSILCGWSLTINFVNIWQTIQFFPSGSYMFFTETRKVIKERSTKSTNVFMNIWEPGGLVRMCHPRSGGGAKGWGA